MQQATKAKAKPKAPARAPLLLNSSAGNVPATDGEHRVKDVYQKMSQIEHVLKRPDMYVGVLEKQQQAMWVHDDEAMVQRTIDFAPGLYKIFDEVLVNAADHSARNPPGSATPMSVMKVVVDKVIFPVHVAAAVCKHLAVAHLCYSAQISPRNSS